jgi:hypothetical protein
MIPIQTPRNLKFGPAIWNQKIKILLLHGGPVTHRIHGIFETFFKERLNFMNTIS